MNLDELQKRKAAVVGRANEHPSYDVRTYVRDMDFIIKEVIAYAEQLKREQDEAMNLLRRAVEAIDSTLDLDDDNFTRPERQRVIDQAITTVTDIHEALKEG